VPNTAWRTWLAPLAALASLIAGTVARFSNRDFADQIWFVALVVLGVPVVWKTVVGISRGQFAADIVASFSIIMAVALHQPFAGLVIVLMQTGGELLESFAERKASRAVRELEEGAPRIAHRLAADGRIDDIAASEVRREDSVLVRPGEMIPCDGTVLEGRSHLDESRITGEPLPRTIYAGARVQSGAVNLDSAVTIRATAAAAQSLYARIVEMVREAQSHKAPTQRIADRYAIWFTPFTLVICAVTWWISGDPVRVLAVLVVATPCPLILAPPVAVVSGIGRAASRHIVVRSGGALEELSKIDAAVFDKTGTLTVGRPDVTRVNARAPWTENELLAFVAAVENHSGHLLARTIAREAGRRDLQLLVAREVTESPGSGVTGFVGRSRVSVGGHAYVGAQQPGASAGIRSARDDSRGLVAYAAIDDTFAGTIEFADRMRDNLRPFLDRLSALGVRKTLLLSGDHTRNVREAALALGIQDARGDLLPQEKVGVIQELLAAGHHVLMTGDGTNDAPALSAASVGVALATNGGGVTAEAADVVLLTDDVTRVADAVAISKRTVRILRQSIIVGIALSCAAMVVASFGYITPAAGALLQELIDVAVIVNALRASRDE
jgi:heavy metal translocating P-type ATPase